MINVTTAIIQDKRIKTTDSKYAIKLRVTYNRQQKYYFLNEHFTIEEWEKINSNMARGKLKEFSSYFNKIQKLANDVIKDLHPFSFDIFENRFFQKPADNSNVLEAMQNYIDQLISEDRIKSASNYRDSLNSIKKFATDGRKKKIHFEDITVQWLQRYEKWILAKGNSISTVGIYIRPLRAIINKGIDNRLLNRESYPFGKDKYQIPASRNIKKSLSLGDINKIVNYKPFTDSEAKARDLWLFSYLCNGANIKDICLLQYKDIDNDCIQFVRAKTKNTRKTDIKPIKVMLLPETKAIIRKWGVLSLDKEAYIFGLLDKDDSAERQTDKIHQVVKNINKYMKRIGTYLEIPHKITTYVARHSFATVLKRSGAPTEFISEALGHASLSTTANYLDSFEDDTKKKFQNALLNFKEG